MRRSCFGQEGLARRIVISSRRSEVCWIRQHPQDRYTCFRWTVSHSRLIGHQVLRMTCATQCRCVARIGWFRLAVQEPHRDGSLRTRIGADPSTATLVGVEYLSLAPFSISRSITGGCVNIAAPFTLSAVNTFVKISICMVVRPWPRMMQSHLVVHAKRVAVARAAIAEAENAASFFPLASPSVDQPGAVRLDIDLPTVHGVAANARRVTVNLEKIP